MTSQKEHIVEQAMHMFVSQGIKSVRMDDIASQLGVSKRTLYELFEDKEGLLYLAMECYYESHRHRWAELTAGVDNVLEALFIVLSDMMSFSDVSSRLMENLKKFYPAIHKKLKSQGMAKNRDSLRLMLKKGIADGLFIDNINHDLSISMLYNSFTVLSVNPEAILPEGVSDREAFLQTITTFFRGVATKKGLEVIDENIRSRELSNILK